MYNDIYIYIYIYIYIIVSVIMTAIKNRLILNTYYY